MSTIQERFGSVDRQAVGRGILAAVSIAGTVGIVASASFLYAAFIVVVNQIFTDAGVFEAFTTVEMEAFRLLFEIPVIAVMGVAVTRLVNIIAGRDYSLTTAATVTAGGWLFIGSMYLWLIDFGVL